MRDLIGLIDQLSPFFAIKSAETADRRLLRRRAAPGLVTNEAAAVVERKRKRPRALSPELGLPLPAATSELARSTRASAPLEPAAKDKSWWETSKSGSLAPLSHTTRSASLSDASTTLLETGETRQMSPVFDPPPASPSAPPAAKKRRSSPSKQSARRRPTRAHPAEATSLDTIPLIPQSLCPAAPSTQPSLAPEVRHEDIQSAGKLGGAACQPTEMPYETMDAGPRQEEGTEPASACSTAPQVSRKHSEPSPEPSAPNPAPIAQDSGPTLRCQTPPAALALAPESTTDARDLAQHNSKRASRPSQKLQESMQSCDASKIRRPLPSVEELRWPSGSDPLPTPPPLPPRPDESHAQDAGLTIVSPRPVSTFLPSLPPALISHLSPDTIASLLEGDITSLFSVLPPLPSSPSPPPTLPIGLPRPKRVATKTAQHAEYIAEKTEWVLPERDLKMKGGFPPVWCLGRQELCESLPYYKAYQGGHYDHGGICKGYLLDAFPSPGDRLEARGRIIISHGGGCSEGEGETYRLKGDQKRDNVRVRALINCQRTQTPVVLLAGSNYAHFPYLRAIGVRYCVLGYYFVRDVWVEAEAKAGKPDEYFTRFKFVFEWAPSQGEPWFDSVIGSSGDPGRSPSPAIDTAQDSSRISSEQIYCVECSQWSPHVFEEPISCYNEACPSFFSLPDGTRPSHLDLTYRPTFLLPLATSAWPSIVPQPLLPMPLQELAHQPADYSRAAWRGFHCNNCGRLSSRSDWRSLACDGCGDSVQMAARIFADAKELQMGIKRTRPLVEGAMGVSMKPLEGIRGWLGWTIDVGEDTRVHHLWPAGGLEREDQLFREYQGEAAGKLFKRNSLSMHRLPGSYLCSQFSFNSGEEYNHVVNVETYPFDRPISTASLARPWLADASTSEAWSDQLPSPPASIDEEERAPSCVREACEHLSSIAQLVCAPTAETVQGFNEVLSVAYMEGGKMSYHDDGEQGLGPIVASLSLGADATMSFRLKQPKKTRKGAQKDEMEAKDKPSTKPLIKLQLRHGDVTIMEGRGVQKDLDHMVEPVNLRFAATARFIGTDHKTRTIIPASSGRGAVCPPGLRRMPTPPPFLPPSSTSLKSGVKKPRKPRTVKPRTVKPKEPSPELICPAEPMDRDSRDLPMATSLLELATPRSGPDSALTSALTPPRPTFAPPTPSPTPLPSTRISHPQFPDHIPIYRRPQHVQSAERRILPSPIPRPLPSALNKIPTRPASQIQSLSDDRRLHNHTSRGNYGSFDAGPTCLSPFSSHRPDESNHPRPWRAQDYRAHPYSHSPTPRVSPTPIAPLASGSAPAASVAIPPSTSPPELRGETEVEQAVRMALEAQGIASGELKLDLRWSAGKVLAPGRV